MHTNTVDVEDLRSCKFYHLLAKFDNARNTINKELLIVVNSHAIYYQVSSFGTLVTETNDMKAAVEAYNKIIEVQ